MQRTGRSSLEIKQLPSMAATCNLHCLIVHAFHSYKCPKCHKCPYAVFQGWLQWKILSTPMALHLWLRSKVFPIGDARFFLEKIFGVIKTSMQRLAPYPLRLPTLEKSNWTEFEGIYYDLLHICDLALYCDMYASSFLVWTADRNIFDARTKDERLIELFTRYISWCKENRTLYHQLGRVFFCFVWLLNQWDPFIQQHNSV